MSRRIIADVTYRSKKVREIQPPELRPEYAWLMAVFSDNGVCEYDSESIWATAYSVARPGWSIEQVQAVIDEFIRVGLYHRYETQGKVWLWLVGSDKEGHLPPPSQRHSTLPLPEDYSKPSPTLAQPYVKPTSNLISALDLDLELASSSASALPEDEKPNKEKRTKPGPKPGPPAAKYCDTCGARLDHCKCAAPPVAAAPSKPFPLWISIWDDVTQEEFDRANDYFLHGPNKWWRSPEGPKNFASYKRLWSQLKEQSEGWTPKKALAKPDSSCKLCKGEGGHVEWSDNPLYQREGTHPLFQRWVVCECVK